MSASPVSEIRTQADSRRAPRESVADAPAPDGGASSTTGDQ
ncbi:hypothetical protein [Streptomyces atratus]|nr:hypothetical protein [Streptomyces atratus]MCX5345536.1 hypothetical protein [Streptomyces atratus]